VRAIIAKEQANLNGITRTDVARTLLEGFEGVTVGVFREGIDLIPIIIRAPEPDRLDINSIRNLQIWSPVAGKSIPLTQVVTGFETVWEDQIMTRTNRRRSITVLCDPEHGLSSNILARVQPQVEALDIPPGYSMEWWGENKSTLEAQASLAGSMPVFILMMIVMVVALFNSLRQTLVIWLIVPLGIIGVTIGLLATGLPFGFLALLGFLSLIGMIIKNSIVLIDEINIQTSEGAEIYDAIISSGASRLRPVSMAAATTVFGMPCGDRGGRPHVRNGADNGGAAGDLRHDLWREDRHEPIRNPGGIFVNRRLLILVLAILVINTAEAASARAQSLPVVRIAFVHDRSAADWAVGFRDSLRQEISRILKVDYTVEMPAELDQTADGTVESVQAALKTLLGNRQVDLIVATGPLGSREAGHLSDLAHPVIGTWVLDPEVQQVPFKDGASGLHNFTYITVGNLLKADIAALDQVVEYDHLVVTGSAGWVASLPGDGSALDQVTGSRASFVTGDGTVESILANLPDDADAVYLMPMIDMSSSQITELLTAFIERKLPVLSLIGEPEVRDGALLGVAPGNWRQRMYRRVALVAAEVISGTEPADIPVMMMRDGRLFLNMRTTDLIGVSPPFEVIIEAVMIDEIDRPGAETIDLPPSPSSSTRTAPGPVTPSRSTCRKPGSGSWIWFAWTLVWKQQQPTSTCCAPRPGCRSSARISRSAVPISNAPRSAFRWATRIAPNSTAGRARSLPSRLW
jgi:ABC-type uncharacterized transport system substrate-binding protein